MGREGNGEGSQGAFVLDAGALIAFERPENRIAAFLAEVIEEGEEILIPASALAQVWRGGPRSARLVRLIAGCQSDTLDEARAWEVGERLGSRGKSDIADAHVVCCAVDRGADLVTSDPEDMKALAEPTEKLVLVSI
jgi:predicted nucleic acid-binding protein